MTFLQDDVADHSCRVAEIAMSEEVDHVIKVARSGALRKRTHLLPKQFLEGYCHGNQGWRPWRDGADETGAMKSQPTLSPSLPRGDHRPCCMAVSFVLPQPAGC